MERKCVKKRYMLQRILAAASCVALLVCALVLPASAATLDYNDYITNVTVDGDNDIVTVSLPVDECHIRLWSSDSYLLAESYNNLLTYNFSSDADYTFEVFPIYPNDLLISNIPDGTLFVLKLDNDATGLGYYDLGRLTAEAYFVYYDPYHEVNIPYSVYDMSDSTWAFELDKQSSNHGDLVFRFMPVSFLESGRKSFSVESFTLQMSISSLYRLQQQTGKTNEILKQVEKQLADQGKTLDEVLQQQQQTNDKLDDANGKLDDLISGGSGADDLIEGGNKIEGAGSGLGEDIGKIEDFENQYMGQLEDNLGDVIAGADLTWLYPPLMFVQRYINKIVAAIPSKYLIVFTLPMLFGLFMYIVGHPVRAPRPDTSGDQVTRETFTETTILSGPNAGRVSSTRTVTTSQEIGRIHNE